MKQLFYVLTLALLASCSNVVDLQQVETENTKGTLPQVTVINPLGEVTPLLASVVAQSQYVATSRGEAMPEIESIEMIKDSKGNPAIYVVNNANNQGFTLISATMDYNPIIATSDEGHFSWEAAQQCGTGIVVGESIQAIEHVAELPDSIKLRFNAAWEEYTATKKDYELPQSRSSEDVYNFIRYKVGQWESQGYTVYTVDNFMSSYAYSSLPYDVQTQIRELPYAYANPNYGGIYNVSFVLVKRPTYSDINISPMITTHWHQEAPYNTAIGGNDVGCVPIAIGQIMYYHGYPACDSIPLFLRDIRRACGIQDSSSSAGSNINKAKIVFNNKGYNSVEKIEHNAAKVKAEIQVGRPVYMRGMDVSSNEGHAWIADGVRDYYQSLEIKLMCLEDCPSNYTPQNFDNPYTYNNLESYIIYFHMNWGSDPQYHLDGYFADSNTSVGGFDFRNDRQDLIKIFH